MRRFGAAFHPPGLACAGLTHGAMPLSDDDILEEAKAAFQLAADAEAENRREALDDLRFARLGEQWPEKVRRERELEGRPVLTINRLPAFIRQVVNDARQNKPAIAAHPVDSAADPQTAEVFNGLIRHVEQSSDAEVALHISFEPRMRRQVLTKRPGGGYELGLRP